MRMAMSHGMHTCMPIKELGLHIVERCRKIWWTVYMLDRQMTCVQGLPQSVDDRFVQTSLPSSPGLHGKTAMLDMHIKLCRRVAEINNSKRHQIPPPVAFSQKRNSSLCHRWTNQPIIPL